MQNTYKGTLYLIRGCSGSGKTTVAASLLNYDSVHFEADMYHYDIDGNYNWKQSHLNHAHKWCQDNTLAAMKLGKKRIVISNTFTTEKELSPYLSMAEENGYNVISLVVENRHGNSNVHNVPESVVEAQENRLRNNLKFRG